LRIDFIPFTVFGNETPLWADKSDVASLRKVATLCGAQIARYNRNIKKREINQMDRTVIRKRRSACACILSQQSILAAESMSRVSSSDSGPIGAGSLSDHMVQCERRFIEQALHANAGRIGESAVALGISRKSLWEKMKRLNLRRKHPDAANDSAAFPFVVPKTEHS
jgi:DNA-binding NtrC family response regulator